VDGVLKEMGDMQYLLSPQDLMAVEMVPSLIEAGVACFKIEGRLKGPEYVALTVSVYRKALDEAWATRVAMGPAEKPSADQVQDWYLPASDRVDMAQVFSRGQDAEYDGLTRGFLEGVKHQRLVRGRGPRHRGPLLGTVTDCFLKDGGGVVVKLRGGVPLKRGDGVVFDRGQPDEPEAGGKVWEVLDERGASIARNVDEAVADGEFELTFASGVVSQWNWDTQEDVEHKEKSGYGTRRAKEEAEQYAQRPKAPARGDLVWRTSDADLDARLRKMIPEGDVLSTSAVRREPVVVTVTAAGVGQPLVVRITDAKGRTGVASTSGNLEPSAKQPMSLVSLAKAIGELGGTPFSVGELDANAVDFENLNGFLPAGSIKSARRAAVDLLVQARQQSGSGSHRELAPFGVAKTMTDAAGETWWGTASPSSVGADANDHETQPVNVSPGHDTSGTISSSKTQESSEDTSQMLTLLCRTFEQAEAAMAVPWLSEITLDFLEVHGLRDAVKAVQLSGKRCVVATPRVLKPDEEKLWRFYLSIGADALLVRSSGLMRTLAALRGAGGDTNENNVPPLHGDFSLNAANAIGACELFREGGLSRLTPTYDLDAKQQANLAKALGKEGARKLEVVIHQHLPIFHTEHCVFCRFLSTGDSYKDCGHPCETSNLHLRDDSGKDHLVLADMGCRNTVFNAQAQSGAEFVLDLRKAGVGRFRVELVDEPGSVVGDLLSAYKDVLGGTRNGNEVVRWVGTLPDANGNAHGAGRGSLETRREKDRGAMKPTAAATRQAARGR
jgi:putative protease